MKPVSKRPARNSGASASARRKPRLVFGPATSVAASAAESRSRASSRLAPWAITLAIIGS